MRVLNNINDRETTKDEVMTQLQLKSDRTTDFPVSLGKAIGDALERRIVNLNDQIREIEYSQAELKQIRYLKQVVSNLENQLSNVRNQGH